MLNISLARESSEAGDSDFSVFSEDFSEVMLVSVTVFFSLFSDCFTELSESFLTFSEGETDFLFVSPETDFSDMLFTVCAGFPDEEFLFFFPDFFDQEPLLFPVAGLF